MYTFLTRRALPLAALTTLAAATAPSQTPTSVSLPRVEFDSLPPGWVTGQLNEMDPIWQPLGARGMNYYSYGAPVPPATYAARSDPWSPFYQAWLGAYVVVGALDSASADSADAQQHWIVALAERDQRSWLEGMGDPSPLAQATLPLRRSDLLVAGTKRALYEGEMRSHSDLSRGGTPLSNALGMPPVLDWRADLEPFHDVVLHVQGAIWYDRARHVTIIVYAASSQFRTRSGKLTDYGPTLDPLLRAAMTRIRIVTAKP
jgi:hypothetical protein